MNYYEILLRYIRDLTNKLNVVKYLKSDENTVHIRCKLIFKYIIDIKLYKYNYHY